MSEIKRFFDEFEFPSYEDWKDAAEKALKGAPFDKKMFTPTYENITLKPIYNRNDFENISFSEALPGEFPFNRGASNCGFLKTPWLIAQEIPYFCPSDFNKAITEDLKNGQTALNIKADTTWAPLAMEEDCEVKKERLSLRNLSCFREAFKGIDFEKTPIFLKGSELSYIYSGYFYAYVKEQNFNFEKIKAFFGIDPFGILVSEGKIYSSPAEYFNQAAKLIEWQSKNSKDSKAILIDNTMYHNAGANAIQELGIAIATGVEYIKELLNRNLNINQIAKSIWFNFSIGTNFFMEIAKLRAARVLWAKIIKEFGGNEEAQNMFIHCDTSWRENTKYDPYVNMLRNASSGFSSVVGNSDSINILNFDNKHGIPDEFSRRTARNTQNVLLEEAHLTDTVDPAGGSWYIEVLTNEVCLKAWDYFKNIEVNGGFYKLIENNTIQKDISATAELRNKNLATRKDVLVGTNKYANLTEKPIEFKPSISQQHLELFCNEVKTEYINRHQIPDQSIESFEELIEKAALNAHVNDILSKVYDNTEPIFIGELQKKRAAEHFESLREKAEEYKKLNGHLPKIYLACYGLLREYKPRADFSVDFFQTGGFTTEIKEGFFNPFELVQGLKDLDANVIVFCSTDDFYTEFINEAVIALKEVKPNTKLILAGYPSDKIEEYSTAGIDEYIHIKANIYDVLEKTYEAFE